MKRVEMEAFERQVTTKGQLRKYRSEGYIPGIIYGEKVGALPVAIKERDFLGVEHKYGKSVLFDLKIGKKTVHAVLKEMQRSPVGRKPVHVDFKAVDLRKPVYTTIPLVMVGEAKGVKLGGILDQTLFELEVEGLLTDLPDKIELDVTNLEIKDVVYVRDLQVPERVKVYSDPEAVVVSIVTPKVEEVAPAPAPEEAEAEAQAKAEAPAEEAKKEEKK